MATGLKNFPNIIPPNSDFLNGRIKDNPGDGSGTPVNQYTNGDIQEFFAKLMDYAGITPNGMPDGEYTGHQFIQALVKHLNYKIAKPIVEGIIGGYTTNDLIVLEGVVVAITGGGNTATWTAGWIYYNGICYYVYAGTLTKSTGVFLYEISDTDDFHITISSGTSGTGIADYGASTVHGIGTDNYTTGSATLSASTNLTSAAISNFNVKKRGNDVTASVSVTGNITSTGALFQFVITMPTGFLMKPTTAGGGTTSLFGHVSRSIAGSKSDVFLPDDTTQNLQVYIDSSNKLHISGLWVSGEWSAGDSIYITSTITGYAQ